MPDKTLSATAAIDLDLACLKERNNFIAVRQGLPPIGATLTNAHGIMWVVDGHTYAPSVMTLGRTETDSDPRDLYPVSVPQNLSQKLQDMLQEMHACTPKDFVPLDTVPHLRPDQAMPYSHSVDSGSDPNRILLFFDAARIHEAAFAHELAHVWLELVEGIEDYRVLEDLSDPVRYGQVQRIQSFVLDFRVNDLIRSRGFDTLELENDRIKSLDQLSIAASKGYRPPSRWESVAMAMLLAEVFIESTKILTRPDDVFETLREKLPKEWTLAEDLAEIVKAEPRSSGASLRQCIDRALTLCFTFAGEHLDLDKDLIERPANVNWRDKWPGWLSELTPQQKCEVGKAMARSGLGGNAKVQLLNSFAGAGVQFSTDGKSWTAPVALPFRLPDPTQPHGAGSRIMEINEQNRRRQMEQFERMKNGNPGRRAYATGEARFITQVRMEQMLAGEHPYAYAFNNPTTYVDPSGDYPQRNPDPTGWPGWFKPTNPQYGKPTIDCLNTYANGKKNPKCQAALGSTPLQDVMTCIIGCENRNPPSSGNPWLPDNGRPPGNPGGIGPARINCKVHHELDYLGNLSGDPCANVRAGIQILCECLQANGGNIGGCGTGAKPNGGYDVISEPPRNSGSKNCFYRCMDRLKSRR